MEIIYPMFTLVIFTFCVGLCVGASRVFSVRKGQLAPEYLKLISGHNPPDYVVQLARNLSNLLEVPLLFYIVAVLIIALKISSPTLVAFAWSFVVLRIVHTLIHVTYNKPAHRFLAYLFSSIVVVVMWVEVVLIINQQI